MKKLNQILLAVVILVLAAGPVMAKDVVKASAAHDVKVTIPEVVELRINKTNRDGNIVVDFGAISAPGNYEKENAVEVTYRCNKRVDWELRVSASDFATGAGNLPIPAEQLSIKVSGALLDKYTSFDHDLTVDSSSEYESAQAKTVSASYKLLLTGAEYEGEYLSTVTYTLVIL